MYARRDQVQAQGYLHRRMILAVLTADPDAPEVPTQRTVLGLVAGSVIMGLLVAGFGVFGLIFPGGATAWRKPGALVLEEETGTTYLYVSGTLRPVLNYASARLLVGGEPPVVSVSRRSLAGVPHGAALGVPGAPDSLPDPGALNPGPWSVCAGTRVDDTATVRPVVSLAIATLPGAVAVGDDAALLVSAPDSTRYLIWRGVRLRVTAGWIPSALGLDAAVTMPVAASWLNAVPTGPDLAAPTVTGRGQAGPTLDGQATRVGQLYSVRTVAGTQTLYLLYANGLRQLSELDATLVLADPATAAAYPDGRVTARPLDPATPAVALAPAAATLATPGDRPSVPPRPVQVGPARAACVLVTPSSQGAEVGLVLASTAVVAATPATAAAGTAETVAGGSPVDGRVADRVRVSAGGGVLARPVVAPDVPGIAYFLITDAGVKYPIPSGDIVTALGYDPARAVPVVPQLLDLLPTGPSLNLEPIIN